MQNSGLFLAESIRGLVLRDCLCLESLFGLSPVAARGAGANLVASLRADVSSVVRSPPPSLASSFVSSLGAEGARRFWVVLNRWFYLNRVPSYELSP